MPEWKMPEWKTPKWNSECCSSIAVNTARLIRVLTDLLPKNFSGSRWSRCKEDAIATDNLQDFYPTDGANLHSTFCHDCNFPQSCEFRI